MNPVFRLAAAALCLALSAHSIAREHDAGGWVTAALKGPLGPGSSSDNRWQYLLHGEYRAFDAFDGVRQSVLRTGAGYRFNDSLQLWGGYGYHTTHLDHADTVKEHRIWQALQWSTGLDNGWTLSTRSRMEQRLFEGRDGTRWRFRQQLKVKIPREHRPDTNWILSIEPFFAVHNPGGKSRGLGQNRFFAGYGFRANDHTRLEVGYLNQWVRNRRGEDLVNHMLQLNLRFSP